jgi:hypothetical protein
VKAEPTPEPTARSAPKPTARPAPTPPPAPAAKPTRPARAKQAEPARERPAVEPVAIPDGAPSDDLDRLLGEWRELVAQLGQHPPTRALIAECRPIAVDGNVVTLGFPETKAFLKDIAERRRSHLEEGIGRFLGRPVAVRCVATNLERFAPLPADAEGDRLLNEARRIFADDLADVGEVS